ncbi:MAG: hypothetical protein ICV51_11215 [Flavisolibacter sp.]|nr:hypothetical protein [Flavisolibacter sp.]MBD0376188.1 hypothetical protein [Flavisolibacter sp.]
MKPSALSLALFLLAGTAAQAQLTLLPQLGFDVSSTRVQINDLRSFSPIGAQGSPKANVRLDYRFKQGHGPFVGIGTSPSVVAFTFADPAMAATAFRAATNNLQWRLEGGYQYSSKPIYFKNAPASTTPAKTMTEKSSGQRSCGSYSYRSHCGENKMVAAAKKDTRLNMRIQPAVGIAYIPSAEESFSKEGSLYQYNAGNWTTALLSGVGFEFAKGAQRKLTVGVQYAKGLGMDTETLTAASDGKVTSTNFRSASSAWSVTVGVPFTLGKKPAPVKIQPAQPTQQRTENKTEYKSKCEEYRARCMRGFGS